VSDWGDFAVVIGASTASLLGFLFVAVSFRGETIAGSAGARDGPAGRRCERQHDRPATIAVLVGGVVNAWLILVRLPA